MSWAFHLLYVPVDRVRHLVAEVEPRATDPSALPLLGTDDADVSDNFMALVQSLRQGGRLEQDCRLLATLTQLLSRYASYAIDNLSPQALLGLVLALQQASSPASARALPQSDSCRFPRIGNTRSSVPLFAPRARPVSHKMHTGSVRKP